MSYDTQSRAVRSDRGTSKLRARWRDWALAATAGLALYSTGGLLAGAVRLLSVVRRGQRGGVR